MKVRASFHISRIRRGWACKFTKNGIWSSLWKNTHMIWYEAKLCWVPIESFGYSMASSVQRISGHARAFRTTLVPWSRPFSADALVEVKPGEIGMVSGIPEEHLRRRVQPELTFSVKLIFLCFIFLIYFQLGHIVLVSFSSYPFSNGSYTCW